MEAYLEYIEVGNRRVGLLTAKKSIDWIEQSCYFDSEARCGEWCPAFIILKHGLDRRSVWLRCMPQELKYELVERSEV